MKNVLYISRAGLPISASGVRIEAIGDLLISLGYRIHFICEKRVDKHVQNSGFSEISVTEFSQYKSLYLNRNEVHYLNNKCIYSYLHMHNGSKVNSVKDILEIYTAKRAFKRIKLISKKEKPQLIILYNDVYGLTKRLIPYCKKNGIILIADVTEWYEKRKGCTLAEYMVVYLTDKRILKLDKKLDGVISISPYFNKYYTDNGVNSILIPPLMKINKNSKKKLHETKINERDVIRFVYAGTPGGKDIIIPFVNAVIRANQKQKRFHIDLIGFTSDYLQKAGCFNAEIKNGIYTYGYLPHDETKKIIENSDFGFLFRYNKRYAKAGFSTKFSECMSLGIAMVCNNIGGTDLFIENGVDGYILDDISDSTLNNFLENLGNKKRAEIERIKENAQKKASKLFDIELYREPLKIFLKEVGL